MTTHITSLAIENVKRVKALRLQPTDKGLIVIGGKNGQGKTSVLDAIAWTLGGGRKAPSNPQRDGAMNPPTIDITLSNGVQVKRSGKNSTLTVIDPEGNRAGQALLDAFVGQFALDLPKFMQGNSREKADALLQTLGIGDELKRLEQHEKKLYDERHAIGQIADKKRKHAEELPEYPDAPSEPVSVKELIQKQQAILAKNGENQRKRNEVQTLSQQKELCVQEITRLQEKLNEQETLLVRINKDLNTAQKTVEQIQDESTAEIEATLADIEATNNAVQANMAKEHAHDEASEYKQQYDDLTVKLESVRGERMALLENANMPLPGLLVEDGELLYNGQKWDCMSGSEQLKVAVAIGRATNPECGFVLVDKLEQMDRQTMNGFGEWLEQEGLQVIATRVSTDASECTLIIEDGLPLGETYIDQITKETTVSEQDDDTERDF